MQRPRRSVLEFLFLTTLAEEQVPLVMLQGGAVGLWMEGARPGTENLPRRDGLDPEPIARSQPGVRQRPCHGYTACDGDILGYELGAYFKGSLWVR